jgi:hypothetical protein
MAVAQGIFNQKLQAKEAEGAHYLVSLSALNHQTLVVMPAKAGIHSHGPVFMDTGFRRYDRSKSPRDFSFCRCSGPAQFR